MATRKPEVARNSVVLGTRPDPLIGHSPKYKMAARKPEVARNSVVPWASSFKFGIWGLDPTP